MANSARRSGRAGGLRRCAWLVIAALAGAVLSGCGFGSGPLLSANGQKGFSSCTPAPNPPAGITTWSTPVAFALDNYYNTASSPVTVTSVTLIDAHHLKIRGALVYEMVHSQHPLQQVVAWTGMAGAASKARIPAAEWAARQPVPGAVIPVERFHQGRPGPQARDLYEIVADISATSPDGGWATGESVTYTYRGSTYTVQSLTGYAIGDTLADPNYCQAQLNAISAAWAN
jgi:hypothetical protein